MNSARNQKDPALDAAVRLHSAGKFSEAAIAYKNILRLRPAHVSALANLGAIYRRQGNFVLSRDCFERALKRDPNHGVSWSNLTSLYLTMGLNKEAVEAGRRAIETAPTLANAFDNFGYALFLTLQLAKAEQVLLQAVKLDPGAANAWNNLGQVYQRQSRLAEAAEAYRRAVALDPMFATAFSNLLFCMHFGSQWTREDIFNTHVQWAQRFEAPILVQESKNAVFEPGHGRRPRVAFISPDLFNHPVAVFLKPLIEHWPHDQFELGFIASVVKQDETTEWFKQCADFWCDIYSLEDAPAAQAIVERKVDILIDLTGHTGGGRLRVMAYRPARIQMSWLGYFDTLGMQSVNYVIADPVCVPVALEHLFTEKVLRLPDGFVCFEPPGDAPQPGPPPALTNGFVTFGSQNQLAKITDAVLDLWCAVMREVPTSRLMFQAKPFNDPAVVAKYAAAFEKRGVIASRIEFLPATSQRGILENYQRMDIALDSFPCAGGTTTCEALWMGVPVVTLLGDRFGGRHSASHLSNVGLPNLIALDLQLYVTIAASLSANLGALAEMRAKLRDQMAASALCDGARFAENFTKLIHSTLALPS
jgi:predicted O-linked N-acetylglucosamine transferase (SPINDLY family)